MSELKVQRPAGRQVKVKKYMYDLIILAGAPGSGKSTVAKLLREKEGFVAIEFGWLQQYHLDRLWSNHTPENEEMAFENLVFILQNYLKHGYKNILVTDLRNETMAKLKKVFNDKNVAVIYLVISDDEELKKRVLGERDSGFKDVDASLKWNQQFKDYDPQSNEFKIDNTHNDPEEIMKAIIKIVK